MRARRSWLLTSFALLALSCAHDGGPAPGRGARTVSSPASDGPLVVLGGAIYTMDPASPRAEVAVAERGRFTCVGVRSACAVAEGARVIDLRGGSATPGLADAHGHVLAYGRAQREVSLLGCASEDECVARLAERARTSPPGAWVSGGGWDQTRWPGGAFPTLAALSRAVPDHPVLATRVDGHAAWVNARALAAAGVDGKTADPPGGKIARDERGAPTGLLVDNACELVESKVPPLDPSAVRDAILSAAKHLVAVGLTSVHDAGVSGSTLEIYRDLAARDALPLRIYAMIDGQEPEGALHADMQRWKETPEVGRLTVRAVKLYADGALGSRGAWMKAPYADDASNVGLTVTEPAQLRARILDVSRAGFQPCVHAIGDRACKETLEDFVAASEIAPGLRPRVEHLQVLDPADVPLLVRSGAVASMQPTHATSDGAWAEARLGHGTERQRGAYAWRQVLDAKVPLACGSDFPVEDIDPRAGIFSAEARRFAGAPSSGWMPEQRLTREEAVRCFTAGAAYAERAEGRRGRIAVGYDADLTAFEGDLFAVPVDAIPHLAVTATVVGGRIEHVR